MSTMSTQAMTTQTAGNQPATTPTTTSNKHRVDSEQGMMILLAVIVAIAVAGIMLVGG